MRMCMYMYSATVASSAAKLWPAIIKSAMSSPEAILKDYMYIYIQPNKQHVA